MDIIFLILGLIFLVLGAEMLVRGGVRLATRLGISSLVIGLTVVAFGTSSPELAVSIKSSLSGQPDIALGNVVGSNIFNVLFILGVSALITPLGVSRQLVRIDIPIMIGVSVLLWLLSLDGRLSRVDGGIFLLGIICYSFLAIAFGKKEASPGVMPVTESEKTADSVVKGVLLCAGGLAILMIGAKWFIDGAVGLARTVGISESVIGLTIVAAGTSLPEVATSIMAAFREEKDIAVGNVVGSNIFNILGILGISCLLAGPEGLSVSMGILDFDIPVMIAVAAACIPVLYSGHGIARWEGLIFLMYYVAYVIYLILESQEHDLLPMFNTTMLSFVIPLTGLTLGILYYQLHRSPRKGNL